MISNFNGILSNNPITIPISDRAFQYGDGVFESIKYENNTLYFFEEHYARLEKGLTILNIEIPKDFKNTLKKEIIELIATNNLKTSRVKIIVWRKEGGLYTPNNNQLNYIITTDKLVRSTDVIYKLGIAKSIRIPVNQLSGLKTLNCLPYILAGIEKKNSDCDELVLLNTKDKICECTSSNVFWKKGDIVYTPSLESGCIAGIERAIQIEELREQSILVKEGLFTIENLESATSVWTTNSFSRKVVKEFKS